jgi:NAD(P)-dependent dehydrogenase (short-subunit alcohol dehydrogenase family)
MSRKGKVLVAMSGGIDSTVAALMLHHEGYEVVGVFMRLGSPDGVEAPESDPGVPTSVGMSSLVAFSIGTVEREIPIYRLDKFGFIHDLWVEPEYRNEGVARQMVMLAVERTQHRYGTVNVLVNNAAAAGGDNVASMDEDTWDRDLTVCLKSAFLCCHYVLPAMIERRRGVIVNIASVNALGFFGNEALCSTSRSGTAAGAADRSSAPSARAACA